MNKVLGRGLSAFLGEDVQISEPKSLPIVAVHPNPYQPRTIFNETELYELAQSIRENGLVQPIVVRVYQKDYQIVAGERRLRACKILGMDSIQAIVLQIDDAKMMEFAILENIQRQDLTPLEEAQAYQRMVTDLGMTQSQIAQKLGKSRSHIANVLRLNTLSVFIKEKLASGELSVGHVKAIMSCDDPEKIARQIIDNELSVRDTEILVARIKADMALSASPTAFIRHVFNTHCSHDENSVDTAPTNVASDAKEDSTSSSHSSTKSENAQKHADTTDVDILSLQESIEASCGGVLALKIGKKGGRATFTFKTLDALYAFLERIS